MRGRERERGDTDAWTDGWARVDGPTVLTLHECADAGATACVTRPTKSKRETWAQPYWPLSITNGPAASRLSSNFPLLPPEPPPHTPPTHSSLPLPLPPRARDVPPPAASPAAVLPVRCRRNEKEVTISPIGYFCFPSEQPARFHPIYLNSKREEIDGEGS